MDKIIQMIREEAKEFDREMYSAKWIGAVTVVSLLGFMFLVFMNSVGATGFLVLTFLGLFGMNYKASRMNRILGRMEGARKVLEAGEPVKQENE